MSVSEAAEQLLEIIKKKNGDHEELGMYKLPMFEPQYTCLITSYTSAFFTQPSSN